MSLLPPNTPQAPAAGPPANPRLAALDGLRFFAVAGVMAVHFSPGTLARFGPWGDWGVRVFFVLSGFFITGILLSARARLDAGRSTFAVEYGRFFARRALRLWPAYFIALAASLALGVAFSREMLPWNLTFTSNYFIALRQVWPGLLSHLWTLAVEFQFYLFWPLLMLAAPRHSLRVALVTLLLAGPGFRLIEALNHPDASAIFLLLPSAVDFFAWGALIAFSLRDTSQTIGANHPGLGAALCFGLSLLVLHLGDGPAPTVWRAIDAGLIAVGAWFLIRHFLDPRPSAFKAVCSLRPLVYLGRISYGIYLYHNLAHRLSPSVIRRLTGENYLPTESGHVAGLVLISILLAMLSWHLIEQPIDRLRSKSTPRP